MRYKLLIIVLTVIQLSCSKATQQELPSEVEKETLERIKKGYHLGTVIGIIDRNGTRYYGFGQKSLADNTTPDEKSIFEIGSITKTFTSTLLSDLNQKGEINIQDSIQTYLPVFKNVLANNTIIASLNFKFTILMQAISKSSSDPFNIA